MYTEKNTSTTTAIINVCNICKCKIKANGEVIVLGCTSQVGAMVGAPINKKNFFFLNTQKK